MSRLLKNLPPGTRVKVVGLPDSGTLIRINECLAIVREDRPSTEVELKDADGEVRQFTGRRSHLTSWSPNTVVEPIGFESQTQENEDMATKAKSGTKPAKKSEGKPGKSESTSEVAQKSEPKVKAKSAGKLSALDAAAKVLGGSKEPMGCKEMIDQMAAKKLWTSPGGKTPASTLYSSILREINTKGKESRFKKAERGKFVATGK